MPLIKGLSELLARREVAPAATISIGAERTTDALIAAEGRQYRPGVRAGTVWCSGCFLTIEAGDVRQHVCEVRR